MLDRPGPTAVSAAAVTTDGARTWLLYLAGPDAADVVRSAVRMAFAEQADCVPHVAAEANRNWDGYLSLCPSQAERRVLIDLQDVAAVAAAAAAVAGLAWADPTRPATLAYHFKTRTRPLAPVWGPWRSPPRSASSPPRPEAGRPTSSRWRWPARRCITWSTSGRSSGGRTKWRGPPAAATWGAAGLRLARQVLRPPNDPRVPPTPGKRGRPRGATGTVVRRRPGGRPDPLRVGTGVTPPPNRLHPEAPPAGARAATRPAAAHHGLGRRRPGHQASSGGHRTTRRWRAAGAGTHVVARHSPTAGGLVRPAPPARPSAPARAGTTTYGVRGPGWGRWTPSCGSGRVGAGQAALALASVAVTLATRSSGLNGLRT